MSEEKTENTHDICRNVFLEFYVPIICLILLTVTIFTCLSTPNDVALNFLWFTTRYGWESHENLRVVDSMLEKYLENNDINSLDRGWYQKLFPGEAAENINPDEPAIALNPNFFNDRDDGPDDMVFAWGHYGDWGITEVFDPSTHKTGDDGFCFMTCDKKIHYCSVSQAKYLRWSKDQPVKPILDSVAVNYTYLTTLLPLGLVLLIYFRQFKRNVGLAITMTVITTFLGFVLTGVSELLYRDFENLFGFGSGKVLFFSPVFGLTFTLLMAQLRQCFKYKRFVIWVIFFGGLTGICCSCVTHMLLRYYYFVDSYGPLLYGLPFGLFAGLFLGLIAGVWLDKRHKKQLAEIRADNE